MNSKTRHFVWEEQEPGQQACEFGVQQQQEYELFRIIHEPQNCIWERSRVNMSGMPRPGRWDMNNETGIGILCNANNIHWLGIPSFYDL